MYGLRRPIPAQPALSRDTLWLHPSLRRQKKALIGILEYPLSRTFNFPRGAGESIKREPGSDSGSSRG